MAKEMAKEKETSQGIQNKWLLLIAIVLGVVVVFIYNAHVSAIREEMKGKAIEVVEMARDLDAGQRLTTRHIRMAEIPRGEAAAFGRVVRWSDRHRLLVRGGKHVNQKLSKGDYLQYDHLPGGSGLVPSSKITEGMVLRGLQFSKDQSPGDALMPNDTINLLGVFSVGGGKPRMYRMIEGVRVLNIAGRGAADRNLSGASSSATRSYRQISIELRKDVALDLANLLTHMQGEIGLELNRRGDKPSMNAGRINPDLKKLASYAKPVVRGGRSRLTTPTP